MFSGTRTKASKCQDTNASISLNRFTMLQYSYVWTLKKANKLKNETKQTKGM